VDCLTLWVSNLMERGLIDAAIEERSRRAASMAAARVAPSVAVTNEVGSGVVSANALGRRYADVLGRVNVAWAEAADRVLLVVSGRALLLLDADDVAGALRGG
jgi:adenosylcobyric acid synthase